MSGRDYSATYFLLCGIALLAMFSTSLILPLIPIYAKQIGATGVVIGFSVAAYWISRIVMEIPSGFVSQRFGYYRSMAVGLGLNVVGTALSAYAVNPIQFVLARALMGIGAPLFFAVATTFVLNLFDAERRGGAMGIFQGIEFAGTIVGSTFSGYVVSVFDFRLSFLFSAGLILIALILVVVPPHIRSESVRMTASSSLSLSAMREVFWNRRLLIVSSATFAEFIMSTGILMTVFPLYASEGLGFSLTSIGLLMGSRSVGFVVAMFSMGAISDRVGRKPVLLFGVGATAVLIAVLNFRLVVRGARGRLLPAGDNHRRHLDRLPGPRGGGCGAPSERGSDRHIQNLLRSGLHPGADCDVGGDGGLRDSALLLSGVGAALR